jgi:hypothetical protein
MRHQEIEQVSNIRNPREYRASMKWKALLSICAVLIGGLGVWVGWLAFHPVNGGIASLLLLATVSAGFIFLGVAGAASAFKSKVTLFADRIEVEGILMRNTLLRSQIRGWRIKPSTPLTLVVQPREKRGNAIKVGLLFPIDHEFSKWFDSLPSLDEEEMNASLDEIEKNTDLGATHSERSENLGRARTQTRILTIVSVPAYLWGFFYPHPYALSITVLSILPCVGVAMVWRSKGLIRIDQRKNDIHPTAAYAVMFPPLVLLLRAVLDFNILWSVRPALISLALGAAFIMTALVADSELRKSKGTAVILSLFSLAYGCGLTIESNALLDRSSGELFTAVVQGQHVDSGKTTSYDLELSPWGPKTGENDLEVSKKTYSAIRGGDDVSIELRKGALGINWYYLDS